MTDIKKINIYMGIVGQAYVDKETAKKNLEAAKKNVLDVKYIIYLINQEYQEDIIMANNDVLYPLMPLPYTTLIEEARNNAQGAKNLAEQVANDLEEKRNIFGNDPQIYNQLTTLIDELRSNDIDGDLTNGGNIVSADFNLAKIEALNNELNDILETARNLLSENENYVNECQTIYEQAKEAFEAYVPEEQETQADKSDRLEAELLRRLRIVAEGIESVNETSDAINDTSNSAQAQGNEIVNGAEPGGGEEPGGEEPGDQNYDPSKDYYYVGTSEPTSIDVNNEGWTELDGQPEQIDINSEFLVPDRTWYVAIPHSYGYQAYDTTGAETEPNAYNVSQITINEIEYDLFTTANYAYAINNIFKA